MTKGQAKMPFRSYSIGTFVAFIACFFVSMTDVKVGPVQIAELCLTLALLFYVVIDRQGMCSVNLKKGDLFILVFFGLACASSIRAYFTESFFIPSDAGSFLKQPGWISFSRLFQILLAYAYFKILISVCRSRVYAFYGCVRAYILSAFFASIYGLISFLLMLGFGVDIGGVKKAKPWRKYSND